MDNLWGTTNQVYMDDYPDLLSAAETGDAITGNPANLLNLIASFNNYTVNAVQEVQAITLDTIDKQRILAQLQSV